MLQSTQYTVHQKCILGTVLVFGPEAVSYERSRRETAATFYHFSARVFFVKISKSQDSRIYTISRFFRIHIPKMYSFPMLFSHPTWPPARPPGHPKYKFRHPKYSGISSETQSVSSLTQSITSDTQSTAVSVQTANV